jgi:hypothetical protein
VAALAIGWRRGRFDDAGGRGFGCQEANHVVLLWEANPFADPWCNRRGMSPYSSRTC